MGAGARRDSCGAREVAHRMQPRHRPNSLLTSHLAAEAAVVPVANLRLRDPHGGPAQRPPPVWSEECVLLLEAEPGLLLLRQSMAMTT
jgi:hypothetical protein